MGNVKIVSASAGSGKTYNLAYEYIRNVVGDPSLYRHILAVTFTNKATEEMKQRILEKINELANCADREYMPLLTHDLALPETEIIRRATTVRSYILHDYNHFAVVTIDKFFQRIIRAFIKELGIDLSFNIELPVDTLLGSAADRIIDDISTDTTLRQWVAAFVDDKISDGRRWNIRDELLSLGQELFKEAYKRHDQTSVPSKKLLQQTVAKAKVRADTTHQAVIATARRWLDLIEANGLTVEDFSQKQRGVAGFVSKLAADNFITPNSYVLDALNDGKWCSASSPRKAQIEALAPQLGELLGELLAALDKADYSNNSATLLKENYRSFALLGDLYTKVLQVAKEENIVHISEINEMLARLIAGNDTPFVFEKAGNYFSHFMIDEFQDTSAMQWENFLPLLHNATSQSDATPVLLVGDVKQSIYRWRGGDWSILAHKAEQAFSHVIRDTLQTNYRSRPEVVRFNNALIGACIARNNDRINRILDEAVQNGRLDKASGSELTDMHASAYADYRQDTPAGTEGGYVTVSCCEDNQPPVIRLVEELQERGYAAGDIAILVRDNKKGKQIASMLLEHKRLHPESRYCYDVLTQDALVIGRSEVVAFVIAVLRLAGNPQDSIRHAIYNRFLDRSFVAPFTDEEETLLHRLRLMPPEEAFEQIVMFYGLGRSQEEIAYLQALHEQILSFTRGNVADTPLFLAWWDKSGSDKSIAMPSGGNAITIDTIHKSKGLGYKVVIIPYCNWELTTHLFSVVWAEAASADKTAAAVGRFPVKYKENMGNSCFSEAYYREYVMSQVDNINLLYVALTRAKEELHLMLPASGDKKLRYIHSLIHQVISRNGGEVRIGDLCGTVVTTESGESLHFGAPSPVAAAATPTAPRFPSYTTCDHTEQMAIKLTAQRYLDDGASDDRLAPRDQGVLLHQAFEQAATAEEIRAAITQFVRNGSLSAAEEHDLTARLDRALANPVIGAWFDGSWEEIRNEAEILLPGGARYRPDRVMIRNGEAVVIDYKFGLRRDARHATQLHRYAELLREMGYASVTGYLWYVNLEEVDPVVRP